MAGVMSAVLPDTGIEEGIRRELFKKIQGRDFLNFPATDRRKIMDRMVRDIADSNNIVLPESELSAMAKRLDEDSFDMGPISKLLKDPAVTEIMINGPDRIFIEKHGRIVRVDTAFKDSRHIMNIIEKILAPLGLRVDEGSPMVDARLGDGSRINVVISPVSKEGIAVTVRKFADDMKTLEQLIHAGSLSSELADFLAGCVKKKINILVSGGTGTGKTTLLNILSGSISDDERIITVEETLELRFTHMNLIGLEARPPNIEGRGEITIRDLVRNALRMRPDRLLVGEIRGAEAVDVLQAMNTGHSGSMTTIHANSSRDAATRLETMLLVSDNNIDPGTAERIIATSLDMIVQLRKLEDGRRVVECVSEVLYDRSSGGKGKNAMAIKDIAVRDSDDNSRVEFTGYSPSFSKAVR